MEISAKKTKLMKNNTGGTKTEIKVNGQKVFVRSICLLDLGTDFLIGNMVFA